VPPLAVEYADTGQDEQDLRDKIATLLSAGTRYVWVVRMTGPRRVEVHQADQARRIVHPGEQLLAPGILQNPVAVEALYDPEVAQRSALHNLLQRHGYADLDAVRDEGRDQGHDEGLKEGHEQGRSEQSISLVLRQLRRRLGGIDVEQEQHIRQLPLPELESLAEALLDFDRPTDLEDWLRAQS